MKKITPILLLIITVAFIGCKKDEVLLTVNSVHFNQGDTYQIRVQCNGPVTYYSEDEYHASVSETGLVTGQYVGKTKIWINSKDDSKSMVFEVSPRYNLYPEPNITIGEAKSSVLSKFGTPDTTTDDGFGYNDYSETAPILMVLLDNNDRVKGYSVFVKTIYTTTLSDFLGERYAFLGYSDDTFMYVNGLTESTATKYIASRYYNADYWWVIYGKLSSKVNNTNQISNSMKLYNNTVIRAYMGLIGD